MFAVAKVVNCAEPLSSYLELRFVGLHISRFLIQPDNVCMSGAFVEFLQE